MGALGSILTHCGSSREHSHPLWLFQGAFLPTVVVPGSILAHCGCSREHSHPLWLFQGAFSPTVVVPGSILTHCGSKLQALVYDILPSTTAVFSYAIGSRKLSANEQFFVGSQTVVSLLQIKQGVIYNRQQSLHQHK